MPRAILTYPKALTELESWRGALDVVLHIPERFVVSGFIVYCPPYAGNWN
ncbi:hypothetical protein DEAC_c38220 [Desulfosporosinus acididurans]|uniref:Uncharacterized protein n=1 Tax=Desulfosporosinus acididurans TaxID=476652 RepID=A0A0J1FKZ8_9FIRM|nr:hypothetical protein [Desulfosporosinus acididurans]KLU64189.1 hypothetical protein DEAC_c38220 [Desulfosporosinus acididurans]